MRKNSVIATMLLFGLAACKPPAAVPPKDGGFEYDYAATEALRRTNLEPAPSSYVLFQRSGDNDVIEDEDARVRAYCVVHYEAYKTVPTIKTEDSFANFVTFYWPIHVDADEEEEAAEAVSDTTPIEKKCNYLTENYDWNRARDLLAELGPDGEYADVFGPVMVLDLVVERVVFPFDDLSLEKIKRIPPIWMDAIDRALREVGDELGEKQAAAKRESDRLDTEIEQLESRIEGTRRPREKELLQAEKESKQGQRRTLLNKWFGRGSWGRAIVCVMWDIAKGKLELAGIPTEHLQAKMTRWCSTTEDDEQGDQDGQGQGSTNDWG